MAETAATADAPPAPADLTKAELRAQKLERKRADREAARLKGREIGKNLSQWVDRHHFHLMSLLALFIFTDLGEVSIDLASQAAAKVYSWNLPSLLYYLAIYQLGYYVLCAVGRVFSRLMMTKEEQEAAAAVAPPAAEPPPPVPVKEKTTAAADPSMEEEPEDASCFFDEELEPELEASDAEDTMDS